MSRIARLPRKRQPKPDKDGAGLLVPFPSQAEARFEDATHAEDSGNQERARYLYETALQLDPEHAGASANLGRMLHEQGQLDEAEDHYRRAARTSPICAFNLGVVLEDQGRLDAAIIAYRNAIALQPTNADAYYNLGRLLERHRRNDPGAYREAVKCLRAYNRLCAQTQAQQPR